MNLPIELARAAGVGVVGSAVDARCATSCRMYVADEVLLGRVEVAVDVAEGRQVEDDRVHLLLGDGGIGAEGHHGGTDSTAPRQGRGRVRA